jgi:transposase-like protein
MVPVASSTQHFSKFLVLVPLRNKEAVSTAAAFSLRVLQYFGACAEVLTDGGKEVEGAFQGVMDMVLIDHRFTPPDHAQSNGLAERCVQTIKRALTSMSRQSGNTDT